MTQQLPEGTYIERHHILPKCMGGSDDPSNLVDLLPEQHYVAHQLLAKIHPGNFGLLMAVRMMTVENPNQQRTQNKEYAWVKRAIKAAGTSEETRAKMRKAWETRPGHSDETKAKIAASLKGRPVSQETRDKIAASQKGVPKPSSNRKQSASEIEKRKASLRELYDDPDYVNPRRGKPRSPEAIAKIKAGIAARKAAKV